MEPKMIEIMKTIRIPLELNGKPGENVFIITDTRVDPMLWQAMAAVANELNMEPTVAIMTPRKAHGYDPTTLIKTAAHDPDLGLVVFLTSTAMAHAPLTEELLTLGKRFLLMDELTPDIMLPEGPAGADYIAMYEIGKKVEKLFTEGKRVRVLSHQGTDLSASIEGRKGMAVAARIPVMRASGGGGCGFPDGETNVCPVEGTGEGIIVFDLTAHNVGFLREPIRLTVEKGMVTKIEGGSEAAKWREIFEKYGDPNSYNCPAEIAVGLNPNVTPIGIMRMDKKLYGATHIGVGDSIVLGGTCKAKLRLEGVIKEPLITVDGHVVTEDGKILVD